MGRKIEVVILTALFIITVGCFSIPVIIYATSSQDAGTNAALLKLVEHFDINKCPQKLIANNTMVESTYSENCSWYKGVCDPHLNHLKTTNNNLSVVVNNDITQQQLSAFLASLEEFSSLISKECLNAVIPFLCQYVYPPCDDDGTAKFITQEQCINIRDEVCISEWRFAVASDLGSLLPVCEAIEFNSINSISLIEKEDNVSASHIKCHYQFKEFCGVCLPLCATFSQYTDQARISEDIIIISSGILAVIGGIIVLTLAVIRRKEMLAFPQVLALYTTINILLYEVLVLISYAGGQGELYCSQETLYSSILNPTLYTEITGFVTHFIFVCGTVTWFLHLLHLFLVVSFPFWSKFLSEQKWKIRLHVVEVFGSVLLCSIAPVTFVSVSDYTITRLPPLFPWPSSDVMFYTIILPNTVLFAIGVNLTVYSLVSIRKYAGLHKRGKTCLVFFSVPEVKILILLSYYILFGIVLLIHVTITINEAIPVRDDLLKYFECQLTGYDPVCEDIRRQFEKHLKPGLNGLSYFLIAFVTWVNLLFAITGEDVKRLMQKLMSCYHLIIKPPFRETILLSTSGSSDTSTPSAANPLTHI